MELDITVYFLIWQTLTMCLTQSETVNPQLLISSIDMVSHQFDGQPKASLPVSKTEKVMHKLGNLKVWLFL